MLDDKRARHSPAARGMIRKRRPFLNPRAVAINDSEDVSTLTGAVLTGPVTITITSTLDQSSTAPSTSRTLISSTSSSSSTRLSASSLSSSTSASISSLTSSSVSSLTSSSVSSTSSSTVTPSPSVSAVSQSSSPSAPDDSSDASSAGSPRLSGGAVAAIAIGVLLLVSAAAVLIGRRCMTRRRQQRRITAGWLNGFTDSTNAQSGANYRSGNQPPMSSVSPSYGDGYAYTGTLSTALGMGTASVAAPQASYNNVPATADYSPRTAPTNRAAVCFTFVPNLPDELNITNGEELDVVQEYDDGWALCVNSKGEEGMVPIECLAGSETTSDFYGERSRRSSRRASSVTGTRS